MQLITAEERFAPVFQQFALENFSLSLDRITSAKKAALLHILSRDNRHDPFFSVCRSAPVYVTGTLIVKSPDRKPGKPGGRH